MVVASIPPPPFSVFHLGPLTIRMYALCIILGVVVAVVVAERRWVARGGRPGVPADIAAWAVPAGLIGARVYHVITDPELYFKAGRHPIEALYIWRGGLGIWGAIAGGAVGAIIAGRRMGIRFAPLADAAAPGIALAQAIGRWGNYFNQELFGRPTHLPWALHVTNPEGVNPPGYYHPTFLYESLWLVGVAAFVVWADRRWQLGHGRVFALYVAAYTAGRACFEALRIDHANHILGLRVNDWVSVLVFTGALVYFVLKRGHGREEEVQEPVDPPVDDDQPADVATTREQAQP